MDFKNWSEDNQRWSQLVALQAQCSSLPCSSKRRGEKNKRGPMRGVPQHHAPWHFSILRSCSAGWRGGYSRYRMLRKAWGVRSQADLGLNFPFTPMNYVMLGKMLELSGHNFPNQETAKITPLHENSTRWSTTRIRQYLVLLIPWLGAQLKKEWANSTPHTEFFTN